MNVEKLGRRHWIGIGLAAGLLLGQFAGRRGGEDLLALHDVIGDQRQFESMLLDQDDRNPRFRDIVLHPAPLSETIDGRKANFIVTGRYYDGPADTIGRPLCFQAPANYEPGRSLERVSNSLHADMRARYAARRVHHVQGYLSLLEDAGVVDYQFAWWEKPHLPELLWAAGGIIVVGIIWPTVINLLIFHRLRRPRVTANMGRTAEADLCPAGPAEPAGTVTQHAPAMASGEEGHYTMRREDYYPTSTKPAFSLVELLVAIGLLTILLAITVPALASARQRGQQVKCASNLRQIGSGLEMYYQVHHELPELATPDGLAAALADLGAPTSPVFKCPSDTGQGLSYSMTPKYAGLPKSAGEQMMFWHLSQARIITERRTRCSLMGGSK